MIYAKYSRVRQDKLTLSNKVDRYNLPCLTSKKFSTKRRCSYNSNREFIDQKEINFNFIYYESQAELMGRAREISQEIQN